MDIYIITGPPYSGKGTQCEIIKKELGLVHISTGDRCRQEKARGTAIGRTMAEYEEKGDLVPDSVMKELFNEVLDENLMEKGIILDGYPRTSPQVDTLLELVNEKGLAIKKVLNIEVPHEELLKRAKKRAETSDRKDDKNAETHIKRIKVFSETTLPAIKYMQERLTVDTFDGMGTVEEITAKVLQVLNVSE